MSLYFDILTPLRSQCPFFEPDTTAVNNMVVVQHYDPNEPYTFVNFNNFARLQAGDSFILQSYGIIMPENFVLTGMQSNALGKSTPVFGLFGKYADVPQTSLYFSELGAGGGYLLLPTENYEMSANVFINVVENSIDRAFVLQGDIGILNAVLPNVSMVNVSTEYNGTTQIITPFIKILHNLPLILF